MDALTRVVEAFRERHGVAPSVVVRAPGRLNLIGDHTDYSLLPVMPFAIDRSVFVAVGEGPGGIEVDSLTHPDPATIEVGGDRSELAGWHRNVAAAVDAFGFVGGAKILVGSDLPTTGGMSASSAITIGSLLALGTYAGDPPPRSELPELALAAERSIGIESGSTDQTVISLAAKGNALRIDFEPLEIRNVPIPEELGIVAAYSGTEVSQGGDVYNSKVVASRLAAALLAGLEDVEIGDRPVLADVASSTRTGELPEEASATEVAADLGLDVDRFTELTATWFDADRRVAVRSVATHALAEARRVDAAEKALSTSDYTTLGRLLDDSHRSLQLFGASSSGLDEVVASMRAAGAYGSRLAGAGSGGYAIAICPLDRIDEMVGVCERATGGPAFRVKPSAGVSGV